MTDTAGNTAPESLADTALAHEIEYLAVKAFADGTRIVNARLDRLGLRARSYSVLALACSGLDPTQRDLAAALELDPSQVVTLVDGLEADGLVRREQDPRDRRQRIIRATPEGQELFRRAQRVTSEAEGEALAMLSDAEREVLREILRKIVFMVPGRR